MAEAVGHEHLRPAPARVIAIPGRAMALRVTVSWTTSSGAVSVAAWAITSNADQGRPGAVRDPLRMRSRTGREKPSVSVKRAAAPTSSAGGPTKTAASTSSPREAAVAVGAPAE